MKKEIKGLDMSLTRIEQDALKTKKSLINLAIGEAETAEFLVGIDMNESLFTYFGNSNCYDDVNGHNRGDNYDIQRHEYAFAHMQDYIMRNK